MFPSLQRPQETTLDSDARIVSLSTKKEYVETRVQAFFKMYSPGLAALSRGFKVVFPLSVLGQVAPARLQELVAGKAAIDISLLRRNTEYSDFEPSDPQIKWFWEVLEEMPDTERSLYIRFVWGRTRIPSTDAEFKTKHEIEMFHGNKQALPIAHTCFFVSRKYFFYLR
jgi:E3 ubiquitin-protein ligase HERC2